MYIYTKNNMSNREELMSISAYARKKGATRRAVKYRIDKIKDIKVKYVGGQPFINWVKYGDIVFRSANGTLNEKR